MKSPLRYPGGKSRLAAKILEFIPESVTVASPFFGGGSVEIALMSRGQKVIGNDAFLPLANFWMNAFEENKKLVSKCAEWLEKPDKHNLFNQCRVLLQFIDPSDLGCAAAAYFVVNRCSFSGATLSGGFSESAANFRFTQSSVSRLAVLSSCKELVKFSVYDFRSFISQCAADVFLYCDPPYYEIDGLYGKNGDMGFGYEDHQDLAAILKNHHKGWALSYNDCPQIRELYQGFEFVELKPSLSMSNGKKSCPEILIINQP